MVSLARGHLITMTFTMKDILNEFVESAQVVTNHSEDAEHWIYRNVDVSRRRAAEWYALPWNHSRKNNYMKEYNLRPGVKERRNARNATPEMKARISAKNKAYYRSPHGSAVRAAARALRKTDEYRAKERLRHAKKRSEGYWTMAARARRLEAKTERGKSGGVSGSTVTLAGSVDGCGPG